MSFLMVYKFLPLQLKYIYLFTFLYNKISKSGQLPESFIFQFSNLTQFLFHAMIFYLTAAMDLQL